VGGFLLNGNGRGQALDVVQIGLVHAAQKLAGISGEALHIAPLPLGKNRIKGQGTFAGPGKPRNNDQFIPRKLKVDVF
jgi:hypothetical protein